MTPRHQAYLVFLLALGLFLPGCPGESANEPSGATGEVLTKAPSEASSEKEFREIMTARIDRVLEGWKSADGPARLVMIQKDLEKACDGYFAPVQLSQYFNGKSTEEVKSILGEPNAVDKRELTGGQTFHYYLGTTTESTESGKRDILSVEIAGDGTCKGTSLETSS